MGLYKTFVESIQTNVDDDILNLDNEHLMVLAMSRLTSAFLHMQKQTLYHAAVLIYLLLEKNDGSSEAIFIDDSEDIDMVYIIGMMGDTIMAFVDNRCAPDGFPYWIEFATNVLSIVLGRPEFTITEFRWNQYSSRSITTP